MAKPIEVTRGTFDQEVRQGAVLVDFWAPWCGPCRREGRLRVLKVNTDEEPYLAVRYGVRSIPTMVLFRSGLEVRRIVGVLPKEMLLAELEPYLPRADQSEASTETAS